MLLGRSQGTINDVEFKQCGLRSQIEQKKEIDVIADEVLAKLVAAVLRFEYIYTSVPDF